MKTLIITVLVFCGALISAAQDVGDSNKFNQYFEQIELDDEQKAAFKEVVLNFDALLSKIDIKNKSKENIAQFNSVLKQEISAVYHLLTREKFIAYKEVKKEIEPNKQFIKQ